jgi:hypothetical protein
VILKRADQRVPDYGISPTPLTWDHAKPGPVGSIFEQDLVFITCDRGHTLRLTGRIHTIHKDGHVTPSWVCTYPGLPLSHDDRSRGL